MARPARLTRELLARKGQALPTDGFAHIKIDLVPPQPSTARLERPRCGTPAPREPLLPDLRGTGRCTRRAGDAGPPAASGRR